MVNRVILIGRLTKDLDLRRTQSGHSVVSFTLAVNRRMSQQGQPDADFINCVAWNKTAENMAQYLSKGSQVAVEGRIQTRNYDNAQGQRVYVTEVVADSVSFLETRNSRPAASPMANVAPAPSAPTNDYLSDFDSGDTLDIASDDLPF